MKLDIELVPQTAWYSNLRNKTKKSTWDKIRKQSYADANNQCDICAKKDCRLNCHEIWSYDDKKHVQKLEGFTALCNDCHMIKHIGFAGIQASKGFLDMEALIQHFMTVNDVDKETFTEHEKEAFKIWNERSQHEWTTDLAEYQEYIDGSEKEQKNLFKE